MLRVISFLLRIICLVILPFVLANTLTNIDLLAQQKTVNNDIITQFINREKNELNFGFRIQSSPISIKDTNGGEKKYFGFCNAFADQLLENLKTKLTEEYKGSSPPIRELEIDKIINNVKINKDDTVNFGTDPRVNPRNNSFTKKVRDVECGANSRDDKFKNSADFSKPFFETGISLIIDKNDFLKVFFNEEKFGDLNIGVVRGTTTEEYFSNYTNKISVKTRDQAVEYLEKGKIQAYASDYVILKKMLDEPRYSIKEKYMVYPKYFKMQEYVIQVPKGEKNLLEIINETINAPNESVKKEINNLNINYKISNQEYLIGFVSKSFLNPFIFFPIVIILMVLIFSKPIRQRAGQIFSDFLKKTWEKFLPDAARWLFNILILRK